MNKPLKMLLGLSSIVALVACSATATRKTETVPSAPAANVAAGKTYDCAAGSDHGPPPNNFQCVDTSRISDQSYCLRSTGHRAEHVRGLQNADSLVTFGQTGYAKVTRYDDVPASDPCYDKTFVPFMDKGDHVIVKRAGTGLTLQITDEKAHRDRFQPALDLKPDAKGGKFFWSGSRDSIDYFVMLADDKLGKMGRNDKDGVKRIEHFYHIEAFKQSYKPTDQCYQARPDFAGSSETGLNFATWKSGQATCDVPISAQQNGSGGGGGSFP